MNTNNTNGFIANRTFTSTRGLHVEFHDSVTALAFYQRVMEKSGWGERKPSKRPVILEATQIIFKTPRSRQVEKLNRIIHEH